MRLLKIILVKIPPHVLRDVFILFGIISIIGVSGQRSTNINSIIPKSPEATAIEKAASLEVTAFSGASNVTIPLLELADFNINIPVSLAYVTSGIRVDQISSSVGMGWSLSSGGVVTRQVRGLPDGNGISYPPNIDSLSQALMDYLGNITLRGQTSLDAQPDIFTYQFANYSGSFYVDGLGNAVETKQSNLKIDISLTGYPYYRYSCSIITPEGISYNFDTKEETYNEAVIVEGSGSGSTTLPAINYAQTAAYLTSIVHPVHGSVGFEYLSNDAEVLTGIQQTYSSLDPTSGNGNPYLTACSPSTSRSTLKSKTSYIGMKLIRKITNSTNDSIVFTYISRNDFMGGKLLSRVALYQGNTLLKSALVSYNNYKAGNTDNFNRQLLGDTTLLNRPFLKSVSFSGRTGTSVSQYLLRYYSPESLPHRLNYAQDHFGFFNNAYNQNMFPPVSDAHIQQLLPLATANREPDSSWAIKGSLSSITYPTGGLDSFAFELHNRTYYEQRFIYNTANVVLNNTSSSTVFSPEFIINNISYEPLQLQAKALVASSDGTSPYPITVLLHYSMKDITNNTILREGDLTAADNVNILITDFTAGHSYQLSLTPTQTGSRGNVSLKYATGNENVFVNKKFPGIRVRKIISIGNQGNQIVKKYYYSPIDSLQLSSAGLYPLVNYVTITYSRHMSNAAKEDCRSYELSSNTVNNLYADAPTGVFYNSIIEGFGENFENGAIEHKYQVERDESSLHRFGLVNRRLFTGINSNNSFLSGLETYTGHYKNVGGILVKVSDMEKRYSLDSRISKQCYGYEISQEFNPYLVAFPHAPAQGDFEAFDVKQYKISTRWPHLDSVIESVYEGNRQFKKKTEYQYDNVLHQLPTKVVTYSSDGKTLTQETKYSSDYSNISGTDTYSAGIKNLQTENITGFPVEELLTVKQGTTAEKFKSATLNVYHSSLPVRTSVEQVENNSTITSFNRSSIVSGVFNKDLQYKPQAVYSYNTIGKLLSQQKVGDIVSSYIYDYQSRYPVAEVKNALQDDIAYTSFEGDGSGNFNTYTGTITAALTSSDLPPAGNNFYNLTYSATIQKAGLTIGATYIISYWSKNGAYSITGANTIGSCQIGRVLNEWTYYEHKVAATAATISITGSGAIDEIRLYPTKAQMTTYTYSPLTGITSQCDQNNRFTYYEYDDFNRLRVIKDQDKNILKKFSYNYQSR